MSENYGEFDATTHESSMLKRLEWCKIFSIRADNDGLFTIEEECDNYFKAKLTADNLRELAADLLALADK